MLRKEIKYLLWTLLGILLYSLSFPGLISEDGIPAIPFIALFPLFFITGKLNYREGIFFGFFYGSGSYLLFNYWLKGFDPVSFTFLPAIMGFYYTLVFIAAIYIYSSYGKRSYIPLTLLWLLYEVFKGENIIGYTYGTMAHSMYRTHLFTGIADITGVYILSLLIIFPSVFAAVLFNTGLSEYRKREIIIPSAIYLSIMLISVLYTGIERVNYAESPTIKTALIQHNIDSWADGNNRLYKETLDSLIELTDMAEKENPELVVWSETAFVPAIEWHKKYQIVPFRYNLVVRLEEYISDKSADFVIGANETVGIKDDEKIYYNSAYHYIGNQIVNKYRKNILVPFTERFPFPSAFKWLKEYIKSIGGKDMTPGTSITNFHIRDFSATPLICYEDTFQSHVRKGILLGGDFIINMTNDAWSSEPACSKQHLAAALFRSIENRRSFIRVGTGGYTCIIDPNGKILDSLPILTRDYIVYDTPVYSGKVTFFTKYGPIIQWFLIAIFSLLIVIKLLGPLIKFYSKG